MSRAIYTGVNDALAAGGLTGSGNEPVLIRQGPGVAVREAGEPAGVRADGARADDLCCLNSIEEPAELRQ